MEKLLEAIVQAALVQPAPTPELRIALNSYLTATGSDLALRSKNGTRIGG